MEQKKLIWYIGARSAIDTVQIGPFNTKEEAVDYARVEAKWVALYAGREDFPEILINSKEVDDGTP